MILRSKGKSENFNNIIVGKISKSIKKEKNLILVVDHEFDISSINTEDYLAVITENSYDQLKELRTPIIHSINITSHLDDGDIVLLNTDGVINTLYRSNSTNNFMFFTERCNSNCLMCSQPPKNKDDSQYFYEVNSKLIPLIPKDCEELGITGGEPTLLGHYFFALIALVKQYLPNTNVPCLTNGRSFAWKNMTQKTAEIDNNNLIFCIPIYADVSEIHDYVVQARNAFHQTVLGIYNLARHNIRIELRIVLHKITIPRLIKLAEYIYKNMPFVEHVAFMGLEIEGYTPFNLDKLWIDPYDYQIDLKEAIFYLHTFGMNVSIYNIPLCLLPKELWTFARKSISDWKNIYTDECKNCSELINCGGFFKSNTKKSSDYIRAL